jgi:UTP--glucose-1-phosphate uridylyltransferase
MSITKAIVPVAGCGTRRLPITKIIEKSMLPVGNRPLVDYSVQELIKAGVKDIYMVISDSEPCQVQEYYKDNLALNKYLIERGKEDRLKLAKTLPDDVTIHYTVQDPSAKYGTAVPIAMVVDEYRIDEPVLVFMGDDFVWNPDGESAAEALIKASENGEHSAILGVEIPREKVEKYGVLSAEDGNLVGVVEKPTPEEAPSNLINVSKYVMTPELLKKIVKYVDEHDFGPKDQE